MSDHTPYPAHSQSHSVVHTGKITDAEAATIKHHLAYGDWQSFYPVPHVPTVKFMKLDSGAVIPTRATPGSACFDLHAFDAVYLGRTDTRVVSTGIGIMIPAGHVGLVCSRSGLAAKGVCVLNAPGVIDEDYTGEIRVILHNSRGSGPYEVAKGDRVAQLMVVPLPNVNFEVVDYLPNLGRGSAGLGSTGV